MEQRVGDYVLERELARGGMGAVFLAHHREVRRPLVAAVTSRPPTPLRTLRPEVPAPLAAIVERCLAKPPGDRYPDAQALADDLGRFLAGERVAGGRRGRPLWVALLLVAGLALLGVRALGPAPPPAQPRTTPALWTQRLPGPARLRPGAQLARRLALRGPAPGRQPRARSAASADPLRRRRGGAEIGIGQRPGMVARGRAGDASTAEPRRTRRPR